MNNKILININNLDEIDIYKKASITNFLFPLEEFSIGFKAFKLNEIPDNSYILVNRIFDKKTLDNFIKIVPELKRFKGILFEDIGVFNLLKNSNIDIELIWNQAHFVINYNSINFYLNNGCNSAVLSSDITGNEIKEILSKVNKSIILPVFGNNMIMYSRRKLLTNYNTYNNIDNINDVILDETHTNNKFFVRESDYGTVIFSNSEFNYFNFIKDIDDNKIKYYLICNINKSPEDIISIINGKNIGNDGFLNKKTVYKMSEYTDRK